MKKVALKQDIRSLSDAELEAWVEEWGEPKYRAKQLQEWLWKQGASSFDEMLNLSKDLRAKLGDNFLLDGARIDLL